MEAIKQQLEEMAKDPDIQREIADIDREFAITEMDGLEISQTDNSACSFGRVR